ncbi:MAG: N-acetylmuramoyl-L-alanine amidase [Lysobacterales bacterium]
MSPDLKHGVPSRYCLGLSASVAFWFSGVALAAVELRSADIEPTDSRTEVTFDLSQHCSYKVFTLANPDRLVIDIADARLGPRFRPTEGGVIKAMRTGRPTADALRIVLDLEQPARPRSFLKAGGSGRVLTVELDAGAPSRRIVRSVHEMESADTRDVLVAIDAGHGGVDPGSSGPSGVREKNVTLALAKELAAAINAEPGMRAVLTRDRDVFIPLQKRYQIARKAKADLFVSIHADAFANRAARGSSVFMLSRRGASSEAARWLAQKENAADLVGGVKLVERDSSLAAVLLDLSQGATLEASQQVANNVLRGLGKVNTLHKHEVQRANFVVLRSPDVPSILVESAFLSNPEEERKLNSVSERRKLANAVLTGIRDHFHAQPLPGTWIAAHRQAPREHIVAPGETIAVIAMRHGISVTSLRQANDLRTDNLRIGVVLRIPQPQQT